MVKESDINKRGKIDDLLLLNGGQFKEAFRGVAISSKIMLRGSTLKKVTPLKGNISSFKYYLF